MTEVGKEWLTDPGVPPCMHHKGGCILTEEDDGMVSFFCRDLQCGVEGSFSGDITTPEGRLRLGSLVAAECAFVEVFLDEKGFEAVRLRTRVGRQDEEVQVYQPPKLRNQLRLPNL